MIEQRSRLQFFTKPIFLVFFLISILYSIATASESNVGTLQEIKKLIPDSISVDGKVVYVDFWASWCVYCRKSFPWINEMQSYYGDSGFVVVAINLDKNHKLAEKFLKDQELRAIHLFDPKGKIAESFGLKVMPTSFVFDRSGKLAFKHEGFQNKDREELEKRLLRLLREKEKGHE